jgi:hypothetical protein
LRFGSGNESKRVQFPAKQADHGRREFEFRRLQLVDTDSVGSQHFSHQAGGSAAFGAEADAPALALG